MTYVTGTPVPQPSTVVTGVLRPNVKLFQDLVDHLVDLADGGVQDRELRMFRRAAQSALEEIISVRPWQYFYRHGRVPLVAPYSTGTVVYDHTGGTYERMLTLSGGTWPSWAAYGRVKIGTVVHVIDRRISDTVVTLDALVNPGADVSSTTYSVFRSHYSLPGDFRSMCVPDFENGNRAAWYAEQRHWLTMERYLLTNGSPVNFTVQNDPHLPGGFVLTVEPYPTAAETVDFMYQGGPVELRHSGYETNSRVGTVTATAGSGTVSGTSTAFAQDMVGEFIRFQSGTDYPTGIAGENPYTEQHQIASVSNATTLTLVTTPSASYTAKKYCISTPVDVDRTLFEALLRNTEFQAAVLNNSPKDVAFFNRYRAQLDKAMEWDNKVESDWEDGFEPYWFAPNYTVPWAT